MADGDGGDRSEALRLNGAPIENIKLEAVFSVDDPFDNYSQVATEKGINAQLSALEMLIYPQSSLVLQNAALMALGTLEIVPPAAPFTLFIWGPSRVLPVKLTEFSITEEAYDTNLNPIRAKVSLGLRVLSYNDLSVTHPGYYLFMAHQVVKEIMSASVTGESLSGIAEGSINI
jgi:hypothetical protein